MREKTLRKELGKTSFKLWRRGRGRTCVVLRRVKLPRFEQRGLDGRFLAHVFVPVVFILAEDCSPPFL